jgi:hypothetical protein
VGKIKDALQNFYAYLFYNPKRVHEFVELINIVET